MAATGYRTDVRGYPGSDSVIVPRIRRRISWGAIFAGVVLVLAVQVLLSTLGLGIGANTAIFSIVNGVILKPLAYPKPGQLVYLTTRFPGFGFEQFWVSPPEYMEFRELNQSFAAVGAYTTGEANLTAGDRPLPERRRGGRGRGVGDPGARPRAALPPGT